MSDNKLSSVSIDELVVNLKVREKARGKLEKQGEKDSVHFS